MKKINLVLVAAILIAGFYGLVNIVLENDIAVSAQRIEKQSYSPYISATGTVTKLDGKTYVTALIGETNISEISVGNRAQITGNGFKGSFDAGVSKIGKNAKKVTVGTSKIVAVEVVLEVYNADESLKQGFTAKAKIFTEDESVITVVPYVSVMQDEKGEYVYVYNNGQAEKTYVKTGRELENGFELISGLSENATVITSPKLLNSDSVSVSVAVE